MEKTYSGKKLGAVIDAQGRKRRWVARQAGISESMLSRIISGNRVVHKDLANRLADLLQAPLFLLFDVHEIPETGTNSKEGTPT